MKIILVIYFLGFLNWSCKPTKSETGSELEGGRPASRPTLGSYEYKCDNIGFMSNVNSSGQECIAVKTFEIDFADNKQGTGYKMNVEKGSRVCKFQSDSVPANRDGEVLMMTKQGELMLQLNNFKCKESKMDSRKRDPAANCVDQPGKVNGDNTIFRCCDDNGCAKIGP